MKHHTKHGEGNGQLASKNYGEKKPWKTRAKPGYGHCGIMNKNTEGKRTQSNWGKDES